LPKAENQAQVALSVRWMVLPAVILTLAMVVFPLGYAIYLSFGGGSPAGLGVSLYARLFSDPVFWSSLKITLGLFIVALILQLVLGTALALLLNRYDVVRGLVRTAILSPFMIPPVVVGMIAIVVLDPGLGAANWVLQSIGLPPLLWLASPEWSLLVVALIVLGGLQSLPARVYEAAEIDGAVGFKRFWYVTLPLLGPTLLTAAVLRSVDLLRFFDIIYITTQGGPGNATTTLNIYAYKLGFEFMDVGYASSLMIALAIIVFGSVLFFTVLRKKVTW
jgi:multiple sugar transport system permease protein